MKTLRLFTLQAMTCLACAALAPALHASAVAKTVAKTAPATLALNYPSPGAPSQDPRSVVIPLYGPLRTLLPEGRLPIWVGRTDGTPLAGVEVVVTVPGDGNLLVAGDGKVLEVRVQTDADGLAVVRLTTPDPNADNGGGGGPAS